VSPSLDDEYEENCFSELNGVSPLANGREGDGGYFRH
jgi:hypothetical protein